MQAGEEVGAKLTVHGMWLPSLLPNTTESPMHALLDALQPDESLLDVGAGVGLYSLAAAAQGNKVVAFEAGEEGCRQQALAETTGSGPAMLMCVALCCIALSLASVCFDTLSVPSL